MKSNKWKNKKRNNNYNISSYNYTFINFSQYIFNFNDWRKRNY